MSQFCASCEFYEQTSATTKDGQKVGFCHLNPPTSMYSDEETQIVHVLPLTYSDWWCSFFERTTYIDKELDH